MSETADQDLQGTSLPTVDHMGTLQCDVWDRAASEGQHKLSQQQVMVRITFVMQKQGQTVLVATK